MLGQKLGGRYQITTRLGQGTFGATFVAQDVQRPGNPECVVKQFKPQVTSSYALREAKRLFDLEAEILETLGHHNQIPQLLAHFEESQEFYLVEEFIRGHDLSEELPAGKQLTEAEVIKLLYEILEVLAFVHQQKVIHRDIKPSNIRRRLDGKIVLIDFGAVKQVSTQMINLQGQTSFTIAIGTPGYMPSEQANRNPKLSSDVYAVGMIGIQALIGILPQQLQPDVKTGEIIWRDRTNISPKLADILDKMVRYDFRQRYQSASEALEAVKRLSPKSPPWKALTGVGVAAAIIPLIVLLSQFKTPKENFLPYENSSLGVKIKYPEGWDKRENPNRSFVDDDLATFFPTHETLADACPLKMVINVNDFLKQPLSLEEYKNLAIEKIKNDKSNSNITEPSNQESTLSSFNAYKLLYTKQDGQCKFQVMEIGTVRNNKAYYII
ncbi:MAG: serine/threonine-protein kinase, partial [Rhizonema sp. NSF051]|nr:serine/threonine-protein kinase [Rhizonema sp. NSF051]